MEGKNDAGEIKLLPAPNDKTNSLSGKVISMKNSSYEYEGDVIHTVILLIADEEMSEIYKIESGRSSLMRSIVNSIASAEELDSPISLRLYNAKENGRARAWVGQEKPGAAEPESLSWKLSFEDQQGMVEVLEKKNKAGKVVETEYDFSEVDKKIFEEMMPEIKLSGAPLKKAEPTASAIPEYSAPTEEEKKAEFANEAGMPSPDMPEEDLAPVKKKRRRTPVAEMKTEAPEKLGPGIEDAENQGALVDDLPF